MARMKQDTMKPTRALSPAAAFFFRNAGWAYSPGTETPEEGRTKGAERLAEAEALYLQAHQVADVRIEWSDDDPREAGYKRGRDYQRTCECAILQAGGSNGYLTGLYAITDADDAYRRVIRAELAMECADALREIIAATTE